MARRASSALENGCSREMLILSSRINYFLQFYFASSTKRETSAIFRWVAIDYFDDGTGKMIKPWRAWNGGKISREALDESRLLIPARAGIQENQGTGFRRSKE
jgi:hypothetical protein